MNIATLNTKTPTTIAYLIIGASHSASLRKAEMIAQHRLDIDQRELMKHVIGCATTIEHVVSQLTSVEELDASFDYEVAEPLGNWYVTFVAESERLPTSHEITAKVQYFLGNMGLIIPEQTSDSQALDEIASILSGEHWSSDTLGVIMQIVTRSGRTVLEVDD